MSWQEELRQLDAQLADGRLTPAEHRRQRDELLAEASGAGSPSPVAAPLRTSTPIRRPRPAEPAEQPTAPAPTAEPTHSATQVLPQWRSHNPSAPPPPPPISQQPTVPAPTPEPAQPKPSAAALLSNGRPTSAPSPADQRSTESMPAPGPQVRQPQPAFSAPPPQQQQQPRWQPTLPLGQPAEQRPEPVAERPSRTLPTWLFLALGVFLVAALIIAGIWWLGGNEENGSGQAPAQQSAPAQAAPPPAAPPSLEDRLPALPGRPNANNSTMSIDRGLELKLFAPGVAAMFKERGATELIYRSTADGRDGYLLMVVPTRSPEDAAQVVQTLQNDAQQVGFTKLNLTLPANSNALSGTNDAGRMNATWYASDNNAVAVWVSQPLDGERSRLSEHLTKTLEAVQAVLPPK
ncbi:hypothetical protein [Amycolatopsis suaedae]|uniref:Uncharacterized protein n=1 Tax=Amycolatopsis suaedae TaxID=2510978 RepID=A0A4Q7J3P8_9PSEU|nr:hypothetical protein [Amycolatopsis suaedae]RZQ62141.1 hypothetical protein EWH70_21440 [Amycolatopsis suaedae]